MQTGFRLPLIAFSLLFFLSARANADVSYHLVGWFNTFVPGGGEALNGNYGEAAIQAPLEVGTFMWGYNLSPKKPLTLDGVPEGLPVPQTAFHSVQSTTFGCIQYNAAHHCIKNGNISTTSLQPYIDGSQLDATTPAYAAILQEFGLKYHMVNVFNSYREAAAKQGGLEYENQKIDDRPTWDMFKDPFKADTMLSPWVWGPLLAISAATFLDYRSQIFGGQPAIQPLTPGTNRLIALNFIVAQPIGSGAPEEMFYRGFVQNEAYHLVASPFFSIPASTLAFSFSHEPTGRLGAAVAGSYLGFLAYHNGGNLSKGIALHFWGVVILGIETYFLTKAAEGLTAPIGTSFAIEF